MKKLIFLLVIAFAVHVSANTDVFSGVRSASLARFEVLSVSSLNWKVGDTLNFNVSIQPFANGTSKMQVTKIDQDGITMVDDMDLGALGKQTMEALIDKDTGAIKKLTVNGQPQTPPSGNMTIITQEEAKITVPAGTYDCVHLVVEDANKERSEMWVNPMIIPMMGLLKEQGTVQGLTIVQELTSFAHGQ